MALDEETLDDEVAKIARFAAGRGHWSERSARDMAAQARLHHASPRAFLRKLLEIKGGLTYDEIARLEKEALAPPPPAPTGKPLPKPFDGSGEIPEARELAPLTPGKALPRPFEGKRPEATSASGEPASPAPAVEIQPMATPSRALPRLMARPADGASLALGSATPTEGTRLKKKLPSLGAKRPEVAPPAPALDETPAVKPAPDEPAPGVGSSAS